MTENKLTAPVQIVQLMNEVRIISELAVKCCTRNPQAHSTDECVECEFKNGMCDSYKLARILYEEGYISKEKLNNA